VAERSKREWVLNSPHPASPDAGEGIASPHPASPDAGEGI